MTTEISPTKHAVAVRNTVDGQIWYGVFNSDEMSLSLYRQDTWHDSATPIPESIFTREEGAQELFEAMWRGMYPNTPPPTAL
jgi:hypothetical protein